MDSGAILTLRRYGWTVTCCSRTHCGRWRRDGRDQRDIAAGTEKGASRIRAIHCHKDDSRVRLTVTYRCVNAATARSCEQRGRKAQVLRVQNAPRAYSDRPALACRAQDGVERRTAAISRVCISIGCVHRRRQDMLAPPQWSFASSRPPGIFRRAHGIPVSDR